MQVDIKGNISSDPKDNILAIEAVTRSLCQRQNADPAEGVMMLLTAAVHMMNTYSPKPLQEQVTALAEALGHATVSADRFFKLRGVSGNNNG